MASQNRSMICASILFLSASVCMGQEDLFVGDLSLKAVKINDQTIAPSNQITVGPGDKIECDIILSNWSPGDLEFAIRGYQIVLIANSFFTGGRGTVLPLGWDAPYSGRICKTDDVCNGSICHPQTMRCRSIFCIDDDICVDPFPVCLPRFFICVSMNHNPELGAFVDNDRPDFIFHEVPPFSAGVVVEFLNFLFGGLVFNAEVEDRGVPAYLGTLILEVSDGSGNEEAACGMFEISYDTRNCRDRSTLISLDGTHSCLASTESLFIDVDCTSPRGVCCDGSNESCTEQVFQNDCQGDQDVWLQNTSCSEFLCDFTPGACCNLRSGTCTNTTLAQCSGVRLNWTRGEDCSDQICPNLSVSRLSLNGA